MMESALKLTNDLVFQDNSPLLEYVKDQGLTRDRDGCGRWILFRIPVSVIHPNDLKVPELLKQFSKANIKAIYDGEFPFGPGEIAPQWYATEIYLEEEHNVTPDEPIFV